MTETNKCNFSGCDFPAGQCAGDCWNENRIDVIGTNGNNGEHYAKKEIKKDMVNHPPHYTKGCIECIDAIESALTKEEFKGYCKAAAIKYLWRLDHKGSAKENAEKAIWYLQRLIKVIA